MEEKKKKARRNSCFPRPKTIEEAREMEWSRSIDAAPLWAMDGGVLRRLCLRGEIPGAVKKGAVWWVPADGMDAYRQAPDKKAANLLYRNLKLKRLGR